MSLKKIFILFLFPCIAIMSISCEDDNKGYEEYYHPMGNNPVQVVRWLNKIKKSFYGKEATISLYKLDGKEYYSAEVLLETDSMTTNPHTVYEKDDEKEIIYCHTDDALASEQDSIYIYFVENAELINILWSNESKYSSF